MSTHLTVHKLAMQFRVRLWALLAVTLVLGLVLYWLAIWAEEKGGWEGGFLSVVLVGIGGISLFVSFFTAAMLWGAHKTYRGAMGSLDWYERDPEAYLRAYREVFGPIPWK